MTDQRKKAKTKIFLSFQTSRKKWQEAIAADFADKRRNVVKEDKFGMASLARELNDEQWKNHLNDPTYLPELHGYMGNFASTVAKNRDTHRYRKIDTPFARAVLHFVEEIKA